MVRVLHSWSRLLRESIQYSVDCSPSLPTVHCVDFSSKGWWLLLGISALLLPLLVSRHIPLVKDLNDLWVWYKAQGAESSVTILSL